MGYDNTGMNGEELARLQSEATRKGISLTELRMAKAVTNSDGSDLVQQVVWDTIGRGTAFGPRPGEPRPPDAVLTEAPVAERIDREEWMRSMLSWSEEETRKFDEAMAKRKGGA
jgi:hypothetical protein